MGWFDNTDKQRIAELEAELAAYKNGNVCKPLPTIDNEYIEKEVSRQINLQISKRIGEFRGLDTELREEMSSLAKSALSRIVVLQKEESDSQDTVLVRFPLIMDKDGDWAVYGNSDREDDSTMLSSLADANNIDHNASMIYWVEVKLPKWTGPKLVIGPA